VPLIGLVFEPSKNLKKLSTTEKQPFTKTSKGV
jgi:hypothetical protein